MATLPPPVPATADPLIDTSPEFRKGSAWIRCESELSAKLAEILLSENLIVLSGLGTSLCVVDVAGARRAPTMWNLWETVQAAQPEFNDIKNKVNYQPPAGLENIETLLSHCQLYSAINPGEADVLDFASGVERLILDKCSFVQHGESLPTHEQFLLKTARRSTRQPRMKLFTTNYDLCFECAAANTNFIVIDGFGHTHPQTFDGAHFSFDLVRREDGRDAPNYIPNVFQLHKLHGSVDWDSSGDRIIKSAIPVTPAMIFPRQGKFELSYRQPFFEMMSRLQMAVRQPNTGLLVTGFGFNDDHIVGPIRSAIASNVGLKCCIVDPALNPDGGAGPEGRHFQELLKLVDDGDRRIFAVAAGFEAIVPYIPDLVAVTEEEEHRRRVAPYR